MNATQVRDLAVRLRPVLAERPTWRLTNAAQLMGQARRAPESLQGKKLERFVAVCAEFGVTPGPA